MNGAIPMKRRFLLPVLLGVLVVSVAGCGGSGGSTNLAAADIAVVGAQHILKSQFDQLMSQAKANLKVQGRTFPKAGSTEYSTLKSQAVTLLVQEAQKEAAATKLGIALTQKDIDTRLAAIKKQYFNGSDAKYRAALKSQGLTDAEVRSNIKSQLIAQKLFNALTKTITVPSTAIAAYYAQHLSQYQTPASRSVRYILLGKNKSSLAQSLNKQLNGAPDATWCTLAKKYSQDKTTNSLCGKAKFSQGQTVPEFDKVVFKLPTKTVTVVNTKQYGWFVVQPTGAITASKKTPVAQAGKQIQQQLLTEKKNAFMTTWVTNIQKSYCTGGKVKYQVGFAPSPDPCAATKTTTT
jgi:parvulin-like peptidyl-prolyl isomerase